MNYPKLKPGQFLKTNTTKKMLLILITAKNRNDFRYNSRIMIYYHQTLSIKFLNTL